jgi:hypothetical protein
MNYKMVASVSFGLVIGLLAWASLRQSEAQGQVGQAKVEWEYKVVAFVVQNADNREVDRQAEQINSLAAEGWEYVGLLCAGSNSGQREAGIGPPVIPIMSGGNVLFKRPKR